MALFFALTLFVSAALLFLVQPMIGRMILPLLGGSPAVWNTCMVFFQALLLLGYLYAHALSTRLPVRRQVPVHLAVLAVPLAALLAGAVLTSSHTPIPVLKSLAPEGEKYPFASVLSILGVAIALPFFAVATSAPLLQKWFAHTGHRTAHDPYYLYGASNLGSLLALLAYPVLMEPALAVGAQNWFWAVGYAVLFGMIALCGYTVLSRAHPRAGKPTPGVRATPAGAASPAPPDGGDPAPAWAEKLRWVGLAFVPSSLMLAVTYYITTDIAALPMLWVIPLALYLLTFIIAFSRMPAGVLTFLALVAPVLILLTIFLMTAETQPRYSVKLLLHLLAFFGIALTLHGELARRRPSTRHLTGFYLWMSVGGMLGGVFNALVAPVIFVTAREYVVTLVVASFLIPNISAVTGPRPYQRALDVLIPLAVGALAAFLLAYARPIEGWLENLGRPRIEEMIYNIVVYGLPPMACYFFVDRPLRFGLCVAAVVLAHVWAEYSPRTRSDAVVREQVVLRERSYFGSLKVTYYLSPGYDEAQLVHGTTLHGSQQYPYGTELRAINPDAPDGLALGLSSPAVAFAATSPLELAAIAKVGGHYWQFPGRDPGTYYHWSGPIGSIIGAMRAHDPKGDIGVVGLGTGTMSCYALPGQRVTFYEIDPTVRRIVEPPTYFTYIDRARQQGATVDFEMGDARLKLEETADRRFAVLVVDAFSSDAIPVHLLTKEAVALYFDRLAEDGLLALHISNRHLDLEPVVAAIADELGLAARVMWDSGDEVEFKTSSHWCVLGRNEAALSPLLGDTRWQGLTRRPDVPAWTDDFSNLISVLEFQEVQKLREWLGLREPEPEEADDDE